MGEDDPAPGRWAGDSEKIGEERRESALPYSSGPWHLIIQHGGLAVCRWAPAAVPAHERGRSPQPGEATVEETVRWLPRDHGERSAGDGRLISRPALRPPAHGSWMTQARFFSPPCPRFRPKTTGSGRAEPESRKAPSNLWASAQGECHCTRRSAWRRARRGALLASAASRYNTRRCLTAGSAARFRGAEPSGLFA